MKCIAPKSGLSGFTCPHCGVLAQHQHFWATWQLHSGGPFSGSKVRTSMCTNCSGWCLWHEGQMVYPVRGDAPPPNPNMPDEVKKEYDEAAAICQQSPRAAAALLRLAVQRLSSILEPGTKDINEAIARLVKKGLPSTIQKALDIVRVTGNHAVHPGTIDTDDAAVAEKLFPLLNLIVEYAISAPARVDELYEALPGNSKEAIEKRDA